MWLARLRAVIEIYWFLQTIGIYDAGRAHYWDHNGGVLKTFHEISGNSGITEDNGGNRPTPSFLGYHLIDKLL